MGACHITLAHVAWALSIQTAKTVTWALSIQTAKTVTYPGVGAYPGHYGTCNMYSEGEKSTRTGATSVLGDPIML